MNTQSSSEHTFTSHDGTSLFYRQWSPEKTAARALVMLHRGHEHSARWTETVSRLGIADTAVFAWDQRGHGQSPGPRGAAENLGVVIRDLESFIRHIEKEHGIAAENIVLCAHSVGAVIAAAWVHDYAPRLRGLILGTPAFEVKLYVPFAIPALRLKNKLMPGGVVKSYVKANVLTHDRAEARAYKEDKAIFREIAVNILLDLFDTAKRVVADAAAIRVPTLVFSADKDWVVKTKPQREFFQRLGSPHKEFHLLRGFHHAIFHEARREEVCDRITDFVNRLFAVPHTPPPPLLDADKHGFTKEEHDHLEWTSDNLLARVQRTVMKTSGKLSDGITLGWQSGFDSGRTLDYVYENKPRGVTPLGRLIDAQYLASPGWAGIRWRGATVQKILRDVMQQTISAGKEARILDIACGGGRYVLETLAAAADIPATAVLRDYKEANLETARATAAKLGLGDRITFARANAFDRSSITAVTPAPTIGIVSGLFELIPDNAPVLEALRGMADALGEGGRLIYTNQPWHPQLKFIAHVLTNREGRAWVMRRRTQKEMDDLVRAAGFVKERQEIDPNGIFSISVARRG